MAKGMVNIFSDTLFNLYSTLNVPCEKGSQGGWPYCQTETGLKVFQEAAEPHVGGSAQSAPSSSSPSSPPKPQYRLTGLQAFWPVVFGALFVICCVLALAWQAHKRDLADLRLQGQYTDLAKTLGEAAQQFGQNLLAEVRTLNTNQTHFATNQNQVVGSLAKLTLVDAELARLLSSQASASRESAAAQATLAQQTTNLVASLHQTLLQGLAEAADRSRADTGNLQAQIADEATNLVASLRQAFQQGFAEAADQSRADTGKLQAQIGEQTTNLAVSLRQAFRQGLAEAADQSRADTGKLQAQIGEQTTNLAVSLRQTFQQGLAEAADQSRADTGKLQARIAEETTNLVASLRQTFQQGLAEAVDQSRADTGKLQAQMKVTTNLMASLRQTFQQGLAEATGQSRTDAAKLQTQIAEVAATCQALLDRAPGSTNVPSLALALPRIIGSVTSGQMAEEYKVATPTPPGVEPPDKVHTRLGTLKFPDGSPDKGTSEKLFDNLDFQRAVQAYLLALPPVSMVAIRAGLTQWGPPNSTIPIFETLVDSPPLLLRTNHHTLYTWMWIDLHNGPLVAEVPPKVSGMLNDSWFHIATDVGFAGPDKGAGGKYLILPPGYEKEVPKGYFVVKAPTFEGFLGWRNFFANGDQRSGIDNVKKFTHVYPLSEAANPPANRFVAVSGQAFTTVAPADYKFWEYLNQVVQREPSGSLDPLTLEYYASVGIQKGRPFTPDARMKKILAEAAAVGDATARTIAFHTRQRSAYYFPSSLTVYWPPAPLPPWR